MILRVSQLSSLAFLYALLNLLQTIAGIPIDNGVIGPPTIECTDGGINFLVNTRNPFSGRIFIKGESFANECIKDFNSQLGQSSNRAAFFVLFDRCGMTRLRMLNPRGMMQSIVIVVSFHPVFVTKVDKAYRVQCFYGEIEKTLTAVLDVSMLPTEDLTDQMRMPRCVYSIHRERPEGPEIRFSQIGDAVIHKWQCDQSEMYRFLVKNCYVEDGEHRPIQVIDENGCVIDPILLGTVQYSPSTPYVYAESHVFKFADRANLNFICQIQICLILAGGCSELLPPRCRYNEGSALPGGPAQPGSGFIPGGPVGPTNPGGGNFGPGSGGNFGPGTVRPGGGGNFGPGGGGNFGPGGGNNFGPGTVRPGGGNFGPGSGGTFGPGTVRPGGGPGFGPGSGGSFGPGTSGNLRPGFPGTFGPPTNPGSFTPRPGGGPSNNFGPGGGFLPGSTSGFIPGSGGNFGGGQTGGGRFVGGGSFGGNSGGFLPGSTEVHGSVGRGFQGGFSNDTSVTSVPSYTDVNASGYTGALLKDPGLPRNQSLRVDVRDTPRNDRDHESYRKRRQTLPGDSDGRVLAELDVQREIVALDADDELRHILEAGFAATREEGGDGSPFLSYGRAFRTENGSGDCIVGPVGLAVIVGTLSSVALLLTVSMCVILMKRNKPGLRV